MALTKVKQGIMAAGTPGGLEYFNASGTPTTLAPGATGQLLKSNGSSAPSWLSTHTGIVSCRYATQPGGNVTVGASETYLNLEVTMPAMKAGSRYRIDGWSSTDDTNSSTYGVGVIIWVRNNTTGGSYWVHKQSRHTIYESTGADHYFFPHVTYVTDGTEWEGWSSGLSAGTSYTFRLYGWANNGNAWFNTQNMSGRYGPAGGLYVYELDGALFQ